MSIMTDITSVLQSEIKQNFPSSFLKDKINGLRLISTSNNSKQN